MAVGRLLIAGIRAVVYWIERGFWAFLAWARRSDTMWRVVDAAGIVIFVGANGSGKSLAMVESVRRAMEAPEWSGCEQVEHRHHKPFRDHAATCEDCDLPADRPGTCPAGEDLLRDLRVNEFYDEHLPVCGDCVQEAPVPRRCSDGFGLIVDNSYGVRRFFSTVPLRSLTGGEHRLYRPLVDYRQLLTIEHSDVLFDEVAGVSDSSDSSGVPVQVTNWLHQLRKRDVRLRVTTPAYSRCSKPIRQIAQVVVDCRSFFPEPRVAGRVWRSRRAMLFDAFDAFDFVDFTAGTADRQKPLARAAFWRPGSLAERLYDTLAAVLALGHVTDSGMCVVCAGSRRRPVCACPTSLDEEQLHDEGLRLEVVETVTAGGSRTRSAKVLDQQPANVPALVPSRPPVESPSSSAVG